MMSELSVAIISRTDAGGGGASKVADDLWEGLHNRPGFAVHRYVGELTSTNAPTIVYGDVISRNEDIYRRLKKRAMRAGYVDHFPLELIGLNPGIKTAKVVHAHDISSVMAPSTLQIIARRRHAIWTLHDMSALTAGCIYPLGCDRWTKGCGSCPQLGGWPLHTRKDKTPELVRRRRRILQSSRIKFVSPSEWLAREIRRFVPDLPVKVINNGVDTRVFKTWNPSPIRERYGLPDKELTVLFVANHLTEVRKGALYIPEIVEYLSATNRKLRMIMVGRFPIKGVQVVGSLEQHFVGHISDRHQLSQLYAAVDAVLLPTHADNFPLVALEAMASGTPIFTFNTGGLSEIVDSNSGVVVPPGRIEMLMQALFEASSSGKLSEMGSFALNRVTEFFNLDRFWSAHELLYREVAQIEKGANTRGTHDLQAEYLTDESKKIPI